MNAPTLDDDRIDQMRASVMHAVDRDIARRGRRARRTVGLAAAGVVVVGLGSVGLGSIDSTSSSGDESSSAGGSRSVTRLDEGAASDSGESAQKAAPQQGREVITTGEVSVTVERPRAVAQRISSYAESIGGRVDTRTEDGSGSKASAYVTVRVPSTKVAATIERLRTYGTVEDVTLQNDDVTAQATDLDARIKALQLSIDRLETILGRADTSAEIIRAEGALTKRQERLESLQAQRKGLTDQVSLSTLSITLSQVPQVDSVEPGGFTGGLKDGWNGLVSTVNHVVEVVGVLLPWAAIALLAYGAWRLVTRRRTR